MHRGRGVSNSSGPSLSDQIRVLVVGDSGIGKTVLSHLVCKGEVLPNSSYTIGCSTEVKIHEFKGRPYYIEFWDLGGSKKYAESRGVVFNHLSINGLILVHDLTNRKSYKNIGLWIKQVIGSDSFKWKVDDGEGGFATHKDRHTLELDTYNGPLPVLIVGTMADLAAREQRSYKTKAISNQPEVVERHSIEVNCMDAASFGENTYALRRLRAFLDQVCTRYFDQPTNRKGTHPPLPHVQIDMTRMAQSSSASGFGLSASAGGSSGISWNSVGGPSTSLGYKDHYP